jgi:tetratricopeptide (TPR) repeat protein
VDVLLVALGLAFAFLAGSFVARNSDVWLHLATGRLIASGNYSFGTDPFCYTTADRYWANHAWFFDLAMYFTLNSLGGGGLVVLKALAVCGIAGVMFLTVRNSQVWLTASCVLLAMLALSPRLLLQPTVVSFLCLGLSLYCLQVGGRRLRAVPVIIALWVNIDSWFILGPALVLLFWIGRRISPERATLPPWPIWLFPASLGACLLSPHHVFAFTLPLELSPSVWTSEFASDPRFAGVFASPWHWAPLGAAGGHSLAAWAFFALLLLSAVSFVVNVKALRSWRGVVWVPFALLAMWQLRLIPFFAVIAGPITALNLGEVVPENAYRRVGRGVVLLTSIVLVVLGWFGMTNGFRNRDRGAAWAVHTDPTLEHTASQLAVWRKENSVPADVHVFATFPDVGHYLSWFAPGERSFLDSRLQLFAPLARDFADISRSVGMLPGKVEHTQELLDKHHIAAVVLHDTDFGRMTRGLREASLWELLHVYGAAVLLVPKDSPYAANKFVPERAAFGTASELRIAKSGPRTMTEPRPFWELQRGRGRKGSWEADAAMVFLRLFEESKASSPALPLLAIRAARVGTETDPNDPVAWLALGGAYLLLGENAWHKETGGALTPLEHIRFVQIVTALTQAVLLDPDSLLSLRARESLAEIYRRSGAIDLAYRHASAALRIIQRAGPQSGETAEAFTKRIASVTAGVTELESQMLDAENRFLVRTLSLSGDPLARARIAQRFELKQRAIDILLKSHADLYGIEGLRLLADLLLQTGQAAECRILLDRIAQKNPDALGEYSMPGKPLPDGTRWEYRFHALDWLDLCQCAAAGRYDAADAAIDRLLMQMQKEQKLGTPQLNVALTKQLLFEPGLWAPPTTPLAPLASLHHGAFLMNLLQQLRFLSAIQADLMTIAGLLELERGEPGEADRRFEAALARYAEVKAIAPSLPGEALAARYHEAIRKHR